MSGDLNSSCASFGVRIEHIEPESPAEECGFMAGDVLVSINGNAIHDAIDYMFHRSGEEVEVVVSRDGELMACIIEKDEFDDPGIVPAPIEVAACRNKCVFCFVHQQPRGFRKSLYLRDDDYRMSFLYGNYITMTNMTVADRQRIVNQRLSPLYVSVHATDPEVRNLMIGNPGAPDVMGELRSLVDEGIRVHTQIVLCPGYNDGDVLVRTIEELGSLGPGVLSLAVVPVGLTVHRRTELRPVDEDCARMTLETVRRYQDLFLKERGHRLVYGADELYIKAGQEFPSLDDYDELPQIENGVGMVPLFLDDINHAEVDELAPAPEDPRCLTFTGASFYPYLKGFTDMLTARGVKITPVMVHNDFFGHSVTVAGLLTGRDVIGQLKGHASGYDRLIVPDVVLREEDFVFLDDVTIEEVSNALGLETVVVESSPYGLIDGVL